MSLRWKIFLFLLAFSLVPMLVVSTVHRQETRNLGSAIIGQIRLGLSDIVAHEITQTARDHALVLARSKSALEFLVEVAAGQTAQALSRRDAALAAALPERPGRPLAGEDGLENDRAAVSVFVPNGTPDAAAREGLEAMRAVFPVFRDAAGQFSEIFSLVGVVLASGPWVLSPGQAALPGDFDARGLAWYQAAEKAFAAGQSGCLWSGPAPDPVTGRMVFTVSRALSGPDGTFAGAAFAQAPLAQALQEGEISSQWSSAMRTYLASVLVHPETGKKALRVWAGPEADAGLSRDILSGAERPEAGPWLQSDDEPRYAAFLERMTAEPSGATVMSFAGQECFWAYATPVEDMQFVLVLPSKVVAPYAEEARKEVQEASGMALATAGAASVLVLLAVALGAFFGSKAVTNPLAEVMRAWERVAAGDFSARLRFKTRDERAALARAFNETMPKLADHMRLRESLELAKQVQQNLLPKGPPSLPGLDVAGINLSCDETGGDYFDHFPIRRGGAAELAVVIGDVTGHGVPSALLMATGRSLLRAAGQQASGSDEAPPPWRRITVANRLLAEDVGDSGRFMTLLWVEIDPATGRLCWVRAGHDPAFVVAPGRDGAVEHLGPGLPLGIVPDFVYQEQQAVLSPGECLLMGTDGIWEARDASGRMYGKTRFLDVARRHATEPAAAIRDAVLADLVAFKGGLPLEDDVTLVVVRRSGPA
ncbi:MAG: SpoIIE family protein phosphatase [Desulfovibrionaceae bacterium]|nr:SpoIIE family protein phosphatase [Desulfovibrionaceae bacterium]